MDRAPADAPRDRLADDSKQGNGWMRNTQRLGARTGAPKAPHDLRAFMLSTVVAALLAACGGGDDTATTSAAGSQAGRAQAQSARAGVTDVGTSAAAGTDGAASLAAANGQAGADAQAGVNGQDGADSQAGANSQANAATHADAFRLLTQATFGPTDADIKSVMSSGVSGWLDKQLAMPPQANYLHRWNADNNDAKGGAGSQTITSAIYQAAMKNDDQLRQRVAFALSQIFVISTQDKSIGNAKSNTSADYYDMLSQDAFGNFRKLLQDVSMHPAMGQYLSSLGNAKEDPAIGRIPDQNFAREVMQLFTIGLVELNIDGTPKKVGGRPVYTYQQGDIDGLSRIFTGWGWYGPDHSQARWKNSAKVLTPNRMWNPMQAYPDYHSTSKKAFLGVVVPAQDTPDPQGNLKVALDTLFNHPNVGPFISKQLIQRLVTSNPSPAYVERVAKVFNDDGQGTRGDLKSVVRAILTDTEARGATNAGDPGFGKVREPVLRLTAFLRAYEATSDSGLFLIGPTDDAGTQLDQSPLRSESVFNFYRPGYMNAGGATANHGLVAPELQITTESSVAGYANFMMTVLEHGVGFKGLDGKASRDDVQPDLSSALDLVTDSHALVDDVTARLIGDAVDSELKDEIRTAVDSIEIPAPNRNHTNGNAIAKAKTNRALTAILLALASPEYIVQK
jgi:uncharacterized protein (DUF1800 family)